MKHATVLCVDDNEIHCYAMVKTLQHAGYNVVHAGTGTEALLKTLEHKPDLVLLDINLPDVNGYEVCSRIKANEETSHIPVVFHTATDCTAGAKMHAEMLGAAAFLTYPVSHTQLLMVIEMPRQTVERPRRVKNAHPFIKARERVPNLDLGVTHQIAWCARCGNSQGELQLWAPGPLQNYAPLRSRSKHEKTPVATGH